MRHAADASKAGAANMANLPLNRGEAGPGVSARAA